MKKVLIWDNFPLHNVGGASGYLYNLHEYLVHYPSAQIIFLSDILHTSPSSFPYVDTKFWKFCKKQFPRLYANIHYAWRVYRSPLSPKDVDVNKYDFIHFHLIHQVLQFIRSYPYYAGKIIVTSHCPSLLVDEMLTFNSRLFRFLRPLALYNEIKCYKHADFWMFPCMEAREPCEKEKSVSKLFTSNEKKFFYVPSAIIDRICENNENGLRATVGIPDDAFVIIFVGRHEEIKGYDVLIKLGDKLLSSISNLYIVCAGSGAIRPLSHPRWIELGFVDNVSEWMSVSDAYISLNKDTYFDLVTLEALRAGLHLFVSISGGNKYLCKAAEEESASVVGVDINDHDSVIHQIANLVNLKLTDEDSYNCLKQRNRRLFIKRFSMSKYVCNYLSTIETLK